MMRKPLIPEDKAVGLIGAGSWGTALAHHLGRKGVSTRLWVFESDILETLKKLNENPVFLPGVKLSPRITYTGDLAVAVEGQPIIIMALPSHVLRGVLTQLVPHLAPGVIVVSASKGIETETLLTMEGVVREVAGPETAYAVL